MASHVNMCDDVLASSYFGKMFATLQKFREENTFCDTVIQGSNREFKAHSAILAAASSVLKYTLQKDGSPGITYRIKLQEVEDNVIENALHYIYTGELLLPSIFASEMSGLLVALNKLGLEPLKFGGCKIQIKSEYNEPNESGSICDTNVLIGSETEHFPNPSNQDCGNMHNLMEHLLVAKVENVSESISPTILDNKADHTGTCESSKTLNSNPKNVTLGNKYQSVDSVRNGRDRNKPLKLKRINTKRYKNAQVRVEKFTDSIAEQFKMSNETEETPTKRSTDEILKGGAVECVEETAIKTKHTCTICQKSFKRKHHLTEHSQIHTGAKPHTCSECGKGFITKNNMKRHLGLHSGLNAKRHKNAQVRVEKFRGSIEKEFKMSNEMEETPKNRSTDEIVKDGAGEETAIKKKHICTICQKSFNRKHHLTEHSRIHTGAKPHTCSECGKGFREKNNMKRHLRLHSGLKPHLCDFCGKGFAGKVNLERHLRIHTQEKPYVCDICARCFRHKHFLTGHMYVHTGEKPYECKVCRKTYRQPHHLKSHMLTHTGEKPYVCSMCEKAYKHRVDLRCHSLRVHKIDITLRIQT